MEKYLLLGLLLTALALFASERFRSDLVALALLLALLLTGILSVEEGFSGFASPAVITVVCMFILSGGLVRAGVADEIARWILARGLRGQISLAMTLMLICGLMSSFMNNIAAVAILLPSVFAIAQRSGVPVSKLLIPLSFASLLGGLTTLIGTPPNLLASEALRQAGYATFAMFDFLPTGLAVFGTGLIYFALVGMRLLPVREAAAMRDEGAALRHYVAETVVPPGSSLAGRRVDQTRLRDTHGLRILRVHRRYRRERRESAADKPWLRHGRHGRDEGDGYSFVPWPEAVLEVDDHLQVEGDPSLLLQNQGRGMLELLDPDRVASSRNGNGNGKDQGIIGEVALSPGSRALGSTIGEADFTGRYGVSVLGLRRNGRQEDERINQLRLETGDVLLVRGSAEALAELGHNPDFLVVNRLSSEARDHSRRWIAIAIMALTMLAAATGLMHISVAALSGVLLMVGSGCMPVRDMYAQVDWRVIFMIAALMPLGIAMDNEHTGAAQTVANLLQFLSGGGNPHLALLAILLITVGMTQVMSNAACVVLVAPIAIQLAVNLGIDPHAFVMGVAIAASTAFITPIGHQANVLVYGVGNYRFNDFIKVGGPLTALILVVAMIVVPMVWPFTR